LQLSTVQRLKLLRQGVLSALNISGNVPVSLEEAHEGVFVRVDGRRICVPSPLRWKLYRKGWAARLDRLEREYGVRRFVQLSGDSVVLDIGANAGEFAHVCDRYGARVHCFEPDPAAFACLQHNITGLANASAYDAVIWRDDGEVDFGLAADRADSSVFAEGMRVRKRCLRIGTFARENGLSRIDLIKCDAEGAEPEVLEGIGDAFPIVGAVALDTGPERQGVRTHEACRAILERHGFQVIDEKIGTRFMTYGVRKHPDFVIAPASPSDS